MNYKKKLGHAGGFLRLAFVAAGLTLFGCATDEVVPERYEPDDSYADYVRAVRELSMHETRIGAEWIESGDPENADPVLTAVPFMEMRLLDVPEQQAAFYLVEGPEGSGYFLDVFRLPDEWRPEKPEKPWLSGAIEAAASAGAAQTGNSSMHFEPLRHRFYIVRLQPRLLEGGEFTIRITADAALVWPVPAVDNSRILSYFGALREAGVRVHHGVDIFASRHTPLVNISDSSEVRRVGHRERGGKIVSLRDKKRNLLIYYAHLETQRDDIEGTEIPAGTRIGTIGNSGNAISTPPHLHIGIYEGHWRNPIDPWYFIVPVDQNPEPPASPPTKIGDYLEIVDDGNFLRGYPAQRSAIVPSPAVTDGDGIQLPESAHPLLEIPEEPARGSRLLAGSVVRLKGVLGEYAFTQAADGTQGYAPVSSLQAIPNSSETRS